MDNDEVCTGRFRLVGSVALGEHSHTHVGTGTVWQGRQALRISVSSWATNDQDIHDSADAIIETHSSYLRNAGE